MKCENVSKSRKYGIDKPKQKAYDNVMNKDIENQSI